VNNDDGELESRINYLISTETLGWKLTPSPVAAPSETPGEGQ
jgi:hypothetical protein